MRSGGVASKAPVGTAVPGVDAACAPSRYAYLLTVHYEDENTNVSFVTVQVSHDSVVRRFADLPGAFDHLLRHVGGLRRSGDP